MHNEKKINGTVVYDGAIVKLHVDDVELENSAVTKREYIEHCGGAAVVAETEKGIIFVEQFRYPYGKTLLEIPAGKRDRGEDPRETARRELKEETGYIAQKLTFLGEVYPSPGYTDEKIYLYVATGLSQGDTCPDEDEFLSLKYLPADEAAKLVASGEIKDAKTQIALLKYFCFFREGQLK